VRVFIALPDTASWCGQKIKRVVKETMGATVRRMPQVD
jgi:hypothetical protein